MRLIRLRALRRLTMLLHGTTLHRTALIRTVGADTRARQRGDVPGWVMVTVMSAGLVFAIWQFAAPELNALLRRALQTVSGIG